MPDKEKLIHAIQDYTGDLDSLNQFTAVMQEQLGDDWVSVIYDVCQGLDEDDKERLDHAVGYHSATLAWEEIYSYLNQANQLDRNLIQERLPVLEHWLNFFGPEGLQAVQALKERLQAEETSEEPVPSETETPQEELPPEQSEVLSVEDQTVPQEPVEQEESSHKATMADIPFMTESSASDTPEATDLAENIPDETAPSQNIGAIPSDQEQPATADVLQNAPSETAVQQTVPQETKGQEAPVPGQPDVPQGTPQPAHLTGEQAYLWLADKIFLQINLMNQIHDWVAARCHSLGNLELNEYSFNGFLTDVQRQTLADIQTLLANPNIHPFLEQRQQGAVNYLKQQQEFLAKTVAQSTSPVPLTKEDLTREEMQRTLGGIDTRHVKEYLGPAPDGFEVVDETFSEEEAKTIKENYEQAEAKIEASTSEAELNPDKALEQNPEKRGLRNMVLNMKPGDAA